MINVEKTVGMVRQLEALIADEEKLYKEKIKPYEELANDMRNQLLIFLNATGQKNAKTNLGTAYKAMTISYRVEDKKEFQRHVIGTEAWGLLVWAVNRAAADKFEEDNKGLPPGVTKTSVIKIKILAPDKKPTRVKQAVNTDTPAYEEPGEEVEIEEDVSAAE